METKVKKQTGTEWTNHKGLVVEAKRITPLEKAKEAGAYKIAKDALKIEKALKALKEVCEQAYDKIMEKAKDESNLFGRDVADGGNLTYYNFDKSIRIIRDVKKLVVYDDVQMKIAKEAFNTYIENNLKGGSNDFIKVLINGAFQTSRGKFDNRKVGQLISHRDHEAVKDDAEFQKAIKHVLEAQQITGEKIYHKVAIRNDQGKYVPLELNFSNL